MSKELKKCPFCGGKAIIKAADKNYGFTIWCQCKDGNCGARTVGYCPDTNNEDNSLENIESCKNKAIEAWNRRVPIAYDPDKVVRQLEEIRPEEDCFDNAEEYKHALSRHNKIIEIVKGM